MLITVCVVPPHAEPEVAVEVNRVKSTGGWVYDGRVCNILAVSRAFGDWEFKVGCRVDWKLSSP
jgi:hypothetical protein